MNLATTPAASSARPPGAPATAPVTTQLCAEGLGKSVATPDGELVGTDQFGNRYYRGRSRLLGRAERRWVLYANARQPDASMVPPEWHAATSWRPATGRSPR